MDYMDYLYDLGFTQSSLLLFGGVIALLLVFSIASLFQKK